MKIRKFQARTTKEALDQVKKTLGPDALILSVKKCGLLNKYVEVTAAIDSPGESIEDSLDAQFNTMQELNLIQDQIKELKEIIRSFIPAGSFGNGVFPFFQQVKKRGLSEEIALKLVEAVEEGMLKEGIDKDISLKDFLYELLSKLVDVYPPIHETNKRIALFLGPTGSGKTTSLVKLAGQLASSFKVGLISLCDSSCGSLSLEYYADQLQLPLLVAKNDSEFSKCLESHSDKDFILIDTPGLNPNDLSLKQSLLNQIRMLGQGLITYAVLDVRTKDEEILNFVRGIKPVEVSALLFTKIDEADAVGTVFNQMIYTGKPLCYIGTGKSVPEDLEIVTPYRLIDLIINLRGEGYAERSEKIRQYNRQ
jgi:flagellar biosynthesis protein FlhF